MYASKYKAISVAYRTDTCKLLLQQHLEKMVRCRCHSANLAVSNISQIIREFGFKTDISGNLESEKAVEIPAASLAAARGGFFSEVGDQFSYLGGFRT